MNISGVVDSKRRDGKGIKIGDDWYSVMFASVLNEVNKGDFVEVEYTTKPSPTGGDYRNIKSVKKSMAPASRPMTAGGAPAGTYSSAGSSAARTFPVGAFSPERSIIRQNSLGHAVKVLADLPIDEGDVFATAAEAADAVIAVARVFEAYSAGDLDREMVEAEMKTMLAKERS